MYCAEVAVLQPASEIARLKLALVCQQHAASTSLVTEEGLAEKRRQALNIYRKLICHIKSKLLDSNRENSHQRWTQQLVYLLMSTNSKSDYIGGLQHLQKLPDISTAPYQIRVRCESKEGSARNVDCLG